MRYLYSQDTCTFSKLLKEAMKAEAEHRSRVSMRAKAVHAEAEVPPDNVKIDNQTNNDITLIKTQLDSMSQILKSAQYQGNKNQGKKGSNSKAVEAQPRSKGPAVTAAGPFQGGRPPVQCHRCMGWGHYVWGLHQ